MESTKTSLWLFLLLNQLPFGLSDEEQTLSTMQPTPYVNLTPAITNFPEIDTNGTRGDCLIDTEMGLIAIGSAGGLIVCMLIAIVVLACEVRSLQRRANAPRSSQSNMDLVGTAAYWGTDQAEVQGLVGPYDTSVMLEEVTPDNIIQEDWQNDRQEAREEDEADLETGAMAMAFDPNDDACQMPTSNIRDSCLEIPKDIEDMPLVV